MKKTILALIIGITFPTLAQADYRETQSRIELCRLVADLGPLGYQHKMQGAARNASGVISRGYTGPLERYAYEYGFDTASSEKSAYMAGWSNCMDNVDRLARAWGR